jgi:hypothetical protein
MMVQIILALVAVVLEEALEMLVALVAQVLL